MPVADTEFRVYSAGDVDIDYIEHLKMRYGRELARNTPIDEADRLRFILANAASGAYFGSHRPMNALAARLVEEEWIGAFKFTGYSSSRMDFELAAAPRWSLSAFTSFRSLESGASDRVTVEWWDNLQTKHDPFYQRPDIRVVENVDIGSAVGALRQVAFGAEGEHDAPILVSSSRRYVIVEVGVGWYKTQSIEIIADQVVNELRSDDIGIIVSVPFIDKLPREWGANLLLRLKQVAGSKGNVGVCCERSGWDLFKGGYDLDLWDDCEWAATVADATRNG